MGEAALRACGEFLPGRQAFGRSLATNDAIIARLADLRTRLDAARLLTERAASLVDHGVPCGREAAMAKLFSSELAVELTSAALHLHGGIGYTTETPLEMLVRDSHAFTIGEGTSEIMRLIIGRAEFDRE
jgi:alkylation response protein AidB-like acyl-CoA dehydrogenase